MNQNFISVRNEEKIELQYEFLCIEFQYFMQKSMVKLSNFAFNTLLVLYSHQVASIFTMVTICECCKTDHNLLHLGVFCISWSFFIIFSVFKYSFTCICFRSWLLDIIVFKLNGPVLNISSYLLWCSLYNDTCTDTLVWSIYANLGLKYLVLTYNRHFASHKVYYIKLSCEIIWWVSIMNNVMIHFGN